MLQVRSGSLSNCNTVRLQGNRFVFLHDGAAGKVTFPGPVPASLWNRVWQVNSCWSVLWGSFSMLCVLVFVYVLVNVSDIFHVIVTGLFCFSL